MGGSERKLSRVLAILLGTGILVDGDAVLRIESEATGLEIRKPGDRGAGMGISQAGEGFHAPLKGEGNGGVAVAGDFGNAAEFVELLFPRRGDGERGDEDIRLLNERGGGEGTMRDKSGERGHEECRMSNHTHHDSIFVARLPAPLSILLIVGADGGEGHELPAVFDHPGGYAGGLSGELILDRGGESMRGLGRSVVALTEELAGEFQDSLLSVIRIEGRGADDDAGLDSLRGRPARHDGNVLEFRRSGEGDDDAVDE